MLWRLGPIIDTDFLPSGGVIYELCFRKQLNPGDFAEAGAARGTPPDIGASVVDTSVGELSANHIGFIGIVADSIVFAGDQRSETIIPIPSTGPVPNGQCAVKGLTHIFPISILELDVQMDLAVAHRLCNDNSVCGRAGCSIITEQLAIGEILCILVEGAPTVSPVPKAKSKPAPFTNLQKRRTSYRKSLCHISESSIPHPLGGRLQTLHIHRYPVHSRLPGRGVLAGAMSRPDVVV